ncbi:YugN family protein [Marinicrinis lubricantis]|uniref:YugN family protein n=1 Tax=Marinicrinis lubricantis TaxID=2086470 RepID=A0ABW1IMS0_9BACL
MIIENAGLKGLKSELSHLDQVLEQAGFVRWQWEYYRATYDYKMIDQEENKDYYLRINARVVEGKLESPRAVLELESFYIGVATFPHGVDYEESQISKTYIKQAEQKLNEIKQLLS